MKINNKILLIFLILFLKGSVIAQVTFYKIKDGVKTVVQEDEAVKFEVSDDGIPLGNLMIEVNVKEFRKKYKYDNILVEYFTPGMTVSSTPRESHTFEDELVKKKYADVNLLNFYAFPNDEYKKLLGDFCPNYKSFYVKGEDFPRKFYIRITGRFKTGTERYWDDYSKSYKTRDVFEGNEIIRVSEITFEENKAITVFEKYRDLIRSEALVEFNGIPTSYKIRSVLKSYASDLAKVIVYVGPFASSVKKYKNLPTAISEIAEAKYQEIKAEAETDKAKALEIFYAWHKEYKNFCIEDDNSDKEKGEKLKLLDKELGGVNTVEQKLTLIRAYIKG